MKRAIKLSKVCDGEPLSVRCIEAWTRTFHKGQHPYTGNDFRSTVDGRCDVTTAIGWKTRTTVKNVAKPRRLFGKTKPWAAALVGTYLESCG